MIDEEPDAVDPSLMAKIRSAAIVQDKALASKNRRDNESEIAAAATKPSTAWGQASRLEAMKERLLALEMEKIAKMDPERLELMNLLADYGHNLDENTITALLAWKRA